MKILSINRQNAACKVMTDISSNLDDNVLTALTSLSSLSRNSRGWRQKQSQVPNIQQEEALKYPNIIKFLKMVINFYFTIAVKMMKGES